MNTVLAIVAFAVVTRHIYLHILAYQTLKAENECLRRHWKETMAGKP